MKMLNDDLKKITEIKQYLLDPPASFKLYDYALQYVEDAVGILKDYSYAGVVTDNLKKLAEQLKNKSLPQNDLRSALKQAGMQISGLTNK